jgi:membrane-bound metal-dependent hydrolase YbcI (DUF457 family)
VEPLIHFVVPFAVLMLAGVEAGKALPISFLAVLPDLDALFLVHRSPSHSLVVVLTVMVPLMLLTYRFKPRFYGYAFLGLLAVVSHLALDVFCGYTPLLWPLYGRSVWIDMEFMVNIGGSVGFSPSVNALTEPTTFEQFHSFDAPLFTGEGLILSMVLLAPVLLRVCRALWQRVMHLGGLR